MFSQEALVGVKLDVEARVPVQPPLDLGVVVGGVVVADEMTDQRSTPRGT